MNIQRNKFNAELVVPREQPKAKYILKRLNDGLTKTGSKVQYVEWDENTSEYNLLHDDIKVNRSLILNPGTNFTWLTTIITEIFDKVVIIFGVIPILYTNGVVLSAKSNI